jgi:hypothetical protein
MKEWPAFLATHYPLPRRFDADLELSMRPWWQIEDPAVYGTSVPPGLLRSQRTDGAQCTYTPELMAAACAEMDRTSPLARPAFRVGQVWARPYKVNLWPEVHWAVEQIVRWDDGPRGWQLGSGCRDSTGIRVGQTWARCGGHKSQVQLGDSVEQDKEPAVFTITRYKSGATQPWCIGEQQVDTEHLRALTDPVGPVTAYLPTSRRGARRESPGLQPACRVGCMEQAP